MRSKALHVSLVVLVAQCVAGLTFAPVLPQMHQAVASHRHVFCPEHNRIEDAVPAGHSADVELPYRQRQARLDSTQAPSLRGVADSECAFSNVSAHFFSRPPGKGATSCSSTPFAIRVPDAADVPVLDALIVAPKNSPPQNC